MPKIAVYNYLTFFFYAADLYERLHVHIIAEKGNYLQPAKIFIENGIEIFEQGNLTQKDLNLCVKLIEANHDKIMNQIEAYKSGKKVKIVKLVK